jgi:hypothetical protein
MTKKTVWIVTWLILLGMLLTFVCWFMRNKEGDWKIEDMRTKCLNQPPAVIPSIMPLEKPYEERFSVLSYQFPSWWKSQLDVVQHNQMPLVDTMPATHPNYKKIVADGQYVWFTYSPASSSLARYDIQTGQIKFYNILDARNKPFQVSDIYLANDKTFWVSLDSLQPGGGYSAIARYQPNEDNFKVIADRDGLFALSHEGWGSGLSDKKIDELLDGRLVVVMDGNIYLYNPTINQAKLLLDTGKVEVIATGKGDNVWFVNRYEDFNLRAVDVRTGKVTDYGLPPQLGKNYKTQLELLDATKAITVDQQGSVWVSYFDRLEPDANGKYNWHSTKLPFVFVNTFDPYYAYRWANVFSTHVFSDGNIWFASDIGIVKYNVNNDNWCLSAEIKTFTIYPITEDAQGNIWTVIDNQIYKLQP